MLEEQTFGAPPHWRFRQEASHGLSFAKEPLGAEVQHVRTASELERENGVSIEVVDPRTLKPFDVETVITSVEKTGRLIIVEEDCRTGGVGAEIAASIGERAFYNLDSPILRVAGADVPMPYSKHLEQGAIPQVEDVVHAVNRILAAK